MPMSETDVRAKIDNCVPKLDKTIISGLFTVALFDTWREQRNMKVRSISKKQVLMLMVGNLT